MNVLGLAEQEIREFTFELCPIVGLHLPNGQRIRALKLFEELSGVAAVQAGSGPLHSVVPRDRSQAHRPVITADPSPLDK